MSLSIIPVTTKKHLKDFVSLPWHLFSGMPNWVPPLRANILKQLDPKNLFYKNAERKLWIAYRDNKPVGRIAGIINYAHNKYHKETAAFWGYFEVENNQETATELFNVVENWGLEKGMSILRGPANPSLNHECGLQISAFDTMPFIMMLQHPPYYQHLVENLQHKKAMDLLAWLHRPTNINHTKDDIKKHSAYVDASNKMRLRYIDMNRYDEEIKNIFEIYNEAWRNNWGFVPVSEEEFVEMAKEMKPLLQLNPYCLPIIEVEGEMAAFLVYLPDINQVLKKNKNGRLFPTGLLKLIWHTKINKKTINRGRIPLLGVKNKFAHLRLAPRMFLELYATVPLMGHWDVECSWILENNRAMLVLLKRTGAEHYKTYRLYEKQLTANQ